MRELDDISVVVADITDLDVDAIVNAANESLLAGGGVCGAIFAAAGRRELQAACDEIGHCDTGDAVITPGFALKARYVVHAVGPRWHGGSHGEPELLASCHARSLDLAAEKGCTSIAFPLILSGIFGYPKRDAWRVAFIPALDGGDERACAESPFQHASEFFHAVIARCWIRYFPIPNSSAKPDSPSTFMTSAWAFSTRIVPPRFIMSL